MKVFWKLLIANFKHFSRERTALFFTFFFPIMFMLIFGLVFSGDVDDMAESYIDKALGLATAEGESPLRDVIIGALEQTEAFSVTEDSVENTLQKLSDGEVNVVLEIPADIDARVAAGEPVTLTIHYNPAAMTAAWQLPVIGQIVDGIGHGISGQPASLAVSQAPIEPSSENTPADNFGINFMVPGVLAMSVLFLGLQGVMPIVEWRENKTLKRLGASPLNRSLIVYSQITQRLILSVIQALLLIGIAYFVFDVQMVGSWWLLLGMLLLGTMALISIGFLIVARAKTVEGATPLVMGIQFPMMFLSGIFFPTDMMPSFMEPIMAALPLTYLGDAFRQIMVNAEPLYPLWVCAAVLGGWLVVTMALTVRFFKWE